jgi:6-phosphogluconolactonase (cycloisomerase 2 family)
LNPDFPGVPVLLFFAIICDLKFFQELRMLRKALGLALAMAGVASVVSCGNTANHYLYATVPAVSQLVVFREDPFSGVLTQLSESPYTVGSGCQSVVVHPSGKFLYVANPGQGENDVSLFDINSNGTVSEVTPRTATGTLPFLLVMDPAGKFLYVANAASNSISVFTIDASSGALTPVTNSPFQINISPKNMQIDPSGNFLYVSAPGALTGLVATFSINAGALTLINAIPTADNNPSGLAIDPKGGFLYASNAAANSISIYTVSASGTLSPVTGSPLADNFKNPAALTVDPTGSFLFVANQGSNNISTYSIASSGFPAPVTDSPFSSEAAPSFVILDPNGKYLYVGNQGSSSLGIQAFGNSSGSLNSIRTFGVGNTPTSLAILAK